MDSRKDQHGISGVERRNGSEQPPLGEVGLTRGDVYIANVLKCRPPGNRDPQPDEIEACETHLFRQIELIRPTLVATLGNFATKLLSGKPQGITRVHGQEQRATLGGNTVTLYPLYHPAAALYTPAMLEVLEHDVARLGLLLGREERPCVESTQASRATPPPIRVAAGAGERRPVQLGLF